MEYGDKQAVADGVNVKYEVYRTCAQASEHGDRHVKLIPIGIFELSQTAEGRK